MNKELISKKQLVTMIAAFVLGSSIVSGGSNVLVQDSWISTILGALMAVPIVLVYGRIIKLYPDKNIFDIFLDLFGKIGGRILIILFTWYVWHLGALVLRNFSEFIHVTSKPETPQIIVMLAILMVVVYLVKSGLKTIGRWSVIVMLVISIVVIITIILGVSNTRMENLLPFFNHSFTEILADSMLIFSFPYAETVLFLSISDSLKGNEQPYKTYLYGLGLGALILLVVCLRNVALLGQQMLRYSFFPSYVAIRIIGVGKFLTKVEGIVMINFMLLGITKIAICLLAATKGIKSIFKTKSYQDFAIPIGVIMAVLGIAIYDNTIQMIDFLAIYPYYAFPFQVLIPLITWIFAEIKHKNKNNGDNGVNATLIKNIKTNRKIVGELKI